jgi:peptidoglycan LD-endopeptidase CwlK
MPESNAICQEVEPGVSDAELQDFMRELKDRGGAHRVWIENRARRKFVCRTFWIEDAPLSREALSHAEAATRAAAPGRAAASSRDLNALVPEFRLKVIALLDRCASRGTPMRPYFTLRSPFEQAKLWRQSRSREQIEARIAELESQSAPFLADCIRRVGPQSGDPVTNAIPGLSWHQWGEAVDCFWLVDGAAEWSPRREINGLNGYQVYAREAQAAGLTAGGLWATLKDWPHVQLRSADSPRNVMSLIEIDRVMMERFGP